MARRLLANKNLPPRRSLVFKMLVISTDVKQMVLYLRGVHKSVLYKSVFSVNGHLYFKEIWLYLLPFVNGLNNLFKMAISTADLEMYSWPKEL